MEQLAPDLCILGACGVDIEAGLTTFGFEDAEFKRFATSRSKRVMVAATSEKFGTAAPHSVLPVAHCECLIVEHDADATMLREYRARGCRTIIADKTG
jgi:DeoR/GlpR family transcriptional regulator of sugar metabolism